MVNEAPPPPVYRHQRNGAGELIACRELINANFSAPWIDPDPNAKEAQTPLIIPASMTTRTDVAPGFTEGKQNKTQCKFTMVLPIYYILT